MSKRPPYDLHYSGLALNDIAALRAFDQRKVIEGIEQHLLHNPSQVSRSRIKRMNQPFWSQFRLRVDELRVYYDVDEQGKRVNVLRVLIKSTGTTPTELP